MFHDPLIFDLTKQRHKPDYTESHEVPCMNEHPTCHRACEHLLWLRLRSINLIDHAEFIAHCANENENRCRVKDEGYRNETVAGPELGDRVKVHKVVQLQTVIEDEAHEEEVEHIGQDLLRGLKCKLQGAVPQESLHKDEEERDAG